MICEPGMAPSRVAAAGVVARLQRALTYVVVARLQRAATRDSADHDTCSQAPCNHARAGVVWNAIVAHGAVRTGTLETCRHKVSPPTFPPQRHRNAIQPRLESLS